MLRGPHGEVAVSYRVRFDGAERAGTVSAALQAVLPDGFTVHHSGEELEINTAEDESVLVDWSTGPGACPISTVNVPWRMRPNRCPPGSLERLRVL